MIAEKRKIQAEKYAHYINVWYEANEEGIRKANEAKPTPMVIEEHSNPLDDSSPVIKQWVEPLGVCGFASIIVHPGNSSFAVWAKNNCNATRNYYGGMTIKRVYEYGQSLELKTAYAEGFAATLRKYGIKAYVDSRID